MEGEILGGSRNAAEATIQLLIQSGLGTGTYIACAACLAGTKLFRNTGLDQGEIEPGSYVLIDTLNDDGMALMTRLDEFLAEIREEPIDNWNLPPLEGSGPPMSLIDLAAKFEPEFDAICSQHEIAPSAAPECAMLAAALFIHRASPVLTEEVGKSIVIQVLVASVKTMPHPRPH